MGAAFLVMALLFPRLTLLYCWLFDHMPANTTPFGADLIGAIFAPRLLVGYWTYDAGVHPIWTVLYVVFFLAAFIGQRARVRVESE